MLTNLLSAKRTLVLDVETYFADDYSLAGSKALTVEEYVRDRRFEMLCFSAYCIEEREYYWIDMKYHTLDDIRNVCQPEITTLVGQNTEFDGLVLSHHFGILFKHYYDIGALCRWAFGRPGPGQHWSLARIVDKLELIGSKNTAALDDIKGLRRHHITDAQMSGLKVYNDDDVYLTTQAFIKLDTVYCRDMTYESRRVQSWTLWNFCNPQLLLERSILEEYADWTEESRTRISTLLDIPEEIFRSPAKLKKQLESEGFEVGMKPSPSNPENEVPAFAKNDEWMKWANLQPGRLGLLTRARLAFSSNIGISRARRLAGMALRGPATVSLNYCGASNTNRLSGGGKVNFQNPPKKLGAEPHPIRRAIQAPEGMQLIVSDLSQIEARINGCLSLEEILVDVFRSGLDVYCDFGSNLLGKKITKEENGKERDFSKAAVLGLGYRMGWPRFLAECVLKGGMTDMTEGKAKHTVAFYRQFYRMISSNWKWFDQAAIAMANGGNEWASRETPDGSLLVQDGSDLVLPTGFRLKFPNMRQRMNEEKGWNEWRFGTGAGGVYHGGIGVENACQSLSWHTMEFQMARMLDAGINLVLQTHDDVGALHREDEIADVEAEMLQHMTVNPPWFQSLPLEAEASHGISLSDCK